MVSLRVSVAEVWEADRWDVVSSSRASVQTLVLVGDDVELEEEEERWMFVVASLVEVL